MHLSEALEDVDINEDFKCKWKELEAALYKAIGKEQNITRLSNFFDKNYSEFHSQHLELIIDQVEHHVNSVLGKPTTVVTDSKGRTLSDFTYTLKTKYRLIFNIVRHLGDDFKQMKDYILQSIADMFDDIKTLIDISDFQKKLVTAFDTRGILNSYRNDIIQAPKKNISANKAEVKKDKEDKKDTPEAVKTFKDEFIKARIPTNKDKEHRTETAAIATNLAEDPNIKTP